MLRIVHNLLIRRFRCFKLVSERRIGFHGLIINCSRCINHFYFIISNIYKWYSKLLCFGFVKTLTYFSTDWQKHGPHCLYLTFFFCLSVKSILSDTKTRTALIAEVQIPSKQNVPTNCHCFASFSRLLEDYSHLVFEQSFYQC